MGAAMQSMQQEGLVRGVEPISAKSHGRNNAHNQRQPQPKPGFHSEAPKQRPGQA